MWSPNSRILCWPCLWSPTCRILAGRRTLSICRRRGSRGRTRRRRIRIRGIPVDISLIHPRVCRTLRDLLFHGLGDGRHFLQPYQKRGQQCKQEKRKKSSKITTLIATATAPNPGVFGSATTLEWMPQAGQQYSPFVLYSQATRGFIHFPQFGQTGSLNPPEDVFPFPEGWE